MTCAAPHDHITHTHTPLRGRTGLCRQGQGLVDSMTHPPDQLVYLPLKPRSRAVEGQGDVQPARVASGVSSSQWSSTYGDLPPTPRTLGFCHRHRHKWGLSLHPMGRGQRCCYMSDKAQDGPLNTAELRLMTPP